MWRKRNITILDLLKALIVVLFLLPGIAQASMDHDTYGTVWKYSDTEYIGFGFWGVFYCESNDWMDCEWESSFFWGYLYSGDYSISFFFLHPDRPVILWGAVDSEYEMGFIIDGFIFKPLKYCGRKF